MTPTFIISLDFELFWGMLDHTSLSDYEANVLGGRQAIPKLLELFEKHGIHATWATVGFMFADNKDELQRYFPATQPTYGDASLNPYLRMDDIGDNEDTAPCFFASSLIRMIASYSGQEIGTHTFSHYYCREAGQTTEQFRADMQSALSIAKDKGYSLKSVVLPRNQCTPEHVKVLSELGFSCYRDEENDWIHEKVKPRALMRLLRLSDVYLPLTGQGGAVPKDENGIINLVGSRMYKPIFRPLRFMEGLKIHRIKCQMKHAAKHGLVFHFWWHPHNIGVNTEAHLRQLEEILNYYDQMKEKYGMVSRNMGEVASSNLT